MLQTPAAYWFLLLFGFVSYPLLGFVLSRYEFQHRPEKTRSIVFWLFFFVIIIGFWLGESEVSMSHAEGPAAAHRFAMWRGVAFGLPYLVLLGWLVMRFLRRPRDEHSSNI